MKQRTQSSPKLKKMTQGFSAINLSDRKLHLPSRYVQQKLNNKNQSGKILNLIQTSVKTAEVQILKSPRSQGNFRIRQKPFESNKKKQIFQFKLKPLKRQQSYSQQFKQIFINPIKQNLHAIQKSKPKADLFKLQKLISKQYDKSLQFETDSKTKIESLPLQFADMNENDVKKHFDQAINLLSASDYKNHTNEQDFYQDQIRIQPPDFPNSSRASRIASSSSYAPSIPLAINFSKQNNLKQLLIKSKTGASTEDIEKQAHLSFYLGMVYQEQINYQSALKFYRRYLGFAKSMQDKIGMALGANRVAINYFYNNQIKKSISFHNQNLKLSDNDNCFAGFYNLGICHRRIKLFDQALQYFQAALQWAIQNEDRQSECITLGQIGVTYKSMELYQNSLQKFEKSLDLCRELKKTKLQLKNLSNILLIASRNQLYSQTKIKQLTFEGFQCAKKLGDKRSQQIFSLNIGIIKGKKSFNDYVQQKKFQKDVQQC